MRRIEVGNHLATGADSWEALSSQPGGSSDRGSDGQASTLTTGRRGMFAALRIEDLGVIGEKGTKVMQTYWPSYFPRNQGLEQQGC